MFKQAYQMGNLQALHTLGMIPDQSLQHLGLMPEDAVGLSPGEYSYPSAYFPQGHSEAGDGFKKLRRIGPAAGATLGALSGLLLRKRLGGVGKGLLTGVGTGATVGWLPDIFATAGEELSS